MPISRASQRDPLRGVVPPPANSTLPTLRIPQARVLRALLPADPSDPPSEWPLLNRAGLGVGAGCTPTSGTITRALNGIREGSSSGDAHPGLLALGLVEEVAIDIEGRTEVNYRATLAGVAAYQAFVAQGGKLPPVKDAAHCTNDRYTKSVSQHPQV